ncbi:MAG: hypothetical protein N4A74_05870, partial [Carboxylicivirga sp.]|nr:hypothetical protein [Carboxylicivirga sp.]
SDFAGVIKQARLLHPVRRHSAGSQVVTTLKNLQNQKLECSSKVLLATLEIDEQKQSTVKKVSTESISEGTKMLEPKLICEKCFACSNPNDQENISNKYDAFQVNYNLSSLQQAGLTTEKANSLVELKWDNASESEKVAANNSHLTYLLRNEDLTTDDQLFNHKNEWNSTFVSYVKNAKSEKYVSDDTSIFVFAGNEQKVELDKKIEEQNSEIKSKKSFQEFLSRLARGEDHSKYYNVQKTELVFNSDRFNGQLLKIDELQIWSLSDKKVSSNSVDARKSYFQTFNIFGQHAMSFEIASLDRVKYVNYELCKFDAFNDINFQSAEQEEVPKKISELAKKQFQNLSSVPEKKVIAEFLSDHNWAHQKDVFKIYSTCYREYANAKTAKTYELLKLNKKCSYTCLKYAHSKDNSLEQITRSGISDLIYTNNPEASSSQFQLDKFEGPPDVPDKTGEYSRTYLKEPDISYDLG